MGDIYELQVSRGENHTIIYSVSRKIHCSGFLGFLIIASQQDEFLNCNNL